MRKTLHIVVALVTLLWAWGVSGVLAQSETGRPFITKWRGEKGKELKIPIVGTYKMVIKDESGNEKLNATVTVEHGMYPYIFTPTEDGIYTVEAGPEGVRRMETRERYTGNEFIPVSSCEALLEVIQFGTVAWDSMNYMFKLCKNMTFSAGIDTPDLSKVTDMVAMFSGCSSFNQPINNWNVSNVTEMWEIFDGCSAFNQPLDNWNVSKLTDMKGMFSGCSSFNQRLDNWNVSNVTNMGWMFSGCSSFNQRLDNWNVSNVTNMSGMFSGCSSFNQPINNWNVSNVKEIEWMFKGCSAFNQPLNDWDVSNVTSIREMFRGCSAFNQPLDKWDVSKVTEMYAMFEDCSAFNQPLNDWDVSKVTDMGWMFKNCSAFNQPLDKWDVSKVTYMGHMFRGCSAFNQPLDKWDVSKVENMEDMFEDCYAFNQPLGSWKIKTVVGELGETAISPSNYSKTLVGWAGQTDIAGSLNFRGNVRNLIYNDEGKAARQKLIDKGWNFEGDIYQASGVSITPRSLLLVLNKECTLPLEKWGVKDTEEVKLSTNTEGIISYEWTADKKGVQIKGLKEGTCKLTATIAAKPGVHEQTYISTCEIVVYVPIERITISPASKTLKVGEEFTFTAHIFPENAMKRVVKWGPYDSEIYKVDNNGKVTAKKTGTCRIYAEINEYGREIYVIYEVTVVDAIAPIASITIPEKQTLTVGTTIPLITVVKPDNAEQGLVWSSSDPEIATVSEGIVWGKKKGECTITVKSLDPNCSITQECKITVWKPSNVTLTQPTNGKIAIEGHATATSIIVAQGTTLTVTVTPDEGYKLKSLTAGDKDITATKEFTITEDTEVKAVFEKKTFVVTTSVNDEKWGSIELTGASDLTAVPYDTELTVKITENKGYELKELKANDEDITKTKKFIVKAATEVKAVFEKEQGGAVEDALLAGIVVAPNPFAAQLRILNPEGVVVRYELVNGAGVVVRSGALSEKEVVVDTEALSAGVYFVRLEAQNGARKSVMVSK